MNCEGTDIGGSILKECPYCNTYERPPRESRSYSSEGSELVRILIREIVYLTLNPNQQSKAAETRRCCGGPVSDHFQSDQFEKMFSNHSSLEVEDHEIENKGFLDYQSFITASAFYQPYGFGTTYINQDFFGTKEVAAFLAHVAAKTSCEHFRLKFLWTVNFNLGFYLVHLFVLFLGLNTNLKVQIL